MGQDRSDAMLQFPHMAEENKKVNVSIPADRASSISALAKEMRRYQETDAKEGLRRADTVTGIIEKRVDFFDKLILLAGGSFALSLTFVFSLSKHDLQNAGIQGIGYLKAGWALMLLSIVLSWIHNWYCYTAGWRFQVLGWSHLTSIRQEGSARLMSRASKTLEGVTAADLNLGEFFDLVSTVGQKESKKAQDSVQENLSQAKIVLVRASRLGNVAFLAVILAFIFLLIFAVKNIPLM
jgi:hypothetical protein